MDTLYLKLSQKKNVIKEKIVLNDIADIICSNKEIECHCKAILIKRFSSAKKQRIIIGVNNIIDKINQLYPQITIVPIGETDSIIEYIPKPQSKFVEFLLVAIVAVIAFVGAAFTIMTFNNDVSASKLFSSLYEQLTGQKSNGITVIEIFYSIGLPLGIIVFFNHFSGHKITTDPPPLEVEMNQYEYDVNASLIKENDRKDSN